MKKAILLRVLILVAILSVPSYFIYKDHFARFNLAESKNILENATTTQVKIDNNLDKNTAGALEVKPVATSSEKMVLKYPMPDINKNWVMPADNSLETTRIITERVAEINESLDANQEQYGKWIDLGVFRKLVGDYSEARNIWEAATMNWPDGLVAYHNLGDIYHFYLKDYVKAEKNMLKVIEINPQYTAEYGLLHDLYRRLYGVKDERVTGILLKGLDNNPEAVDIMISLASAYKEAGDTINAKKYYEIALVRANELKDIGLQKSIESDLADL